MSLPVITLRPPLYNLKHENKTTNRNYKTKTTNSIFQTLASLLSNDLIKKTFYDYV